MAEDTPSVPRSLNPGFRGKIAVFETLDSARSRTREALDKLGYSLTPEVSEGAIESSGLGDQPPEILIVSLPEGQALVESLQKASRPPVVVASLAGPARKARERFNLSQTELYTVRPSSAESLGPVLHAATMLCMSKHRELALRIAEDRMRERLEEAGHSSTNAGFQTFEFFKRVLILEIKRAKRYDYGIAVCVVAPDPYSEPGPSLKLRAELSKKMAEAVSSSIRDIDMGVDYAEDRMLLFLPYTDAVGAREVGERVAKTVRSTVHGGEGVKQLGCTVSVGIAALKKDQELSFARLMRDANAALKAAQLKGGDRVVCRE